MENPGYDRQAVADHANNLAARIRGNLTNSLKALGVDILTGVGTIVVSFWRFLKNTRFILTYYNGGNVVLLLSLNY